MTKYLVKTTRGSADIIPIPKGSIKPIKDVAVRYWQKKGYKQINAKSESAAVKWILKRR